MSNEILDKNFAPDAQEYAEALSLLIKCKTISDKKHTFQQEFDNLCAALRDTYPKLLDRAARPFNDLLLLHFKGSEQGNPLVLMSHSDVVPENGKWSKDAWSGEIKDGVIWGRGSVDTKGSLVAIFEALDGLFSEGFTPKKDIIVFSSFSEEIAGDDAANAVKYLKQSNIPAPKLVLDEGGGIVDPPVPGVTGKFAMIGMAERGSARLFLEADKDKNGSAAEKISNFVLEASGKVFGKRGFGTVNTAMFDAMKPNMNGAMRFVFNNLKLFNKPLIKLLPVVNKTAATILGPTVVFSNPTSAEAAALPFEGYGTIARISTNSDNPIDDVVKEFSQFAESRGIKVTVLTKRAAPKDAPIDGDGYKFTADLIRDVFTGVTPAPYNILGGTDARHFIGYAENVVRFAPIYMNNQQFSSFHRTDENLNVSSLADAVRFYREAILRFDAGLLQ